MAKFSPKSLKFIRRHPKNDAVINILEGSVRSSKTWTMIPKLIFGLNNYDIPGDKIIFGVSKDTIYNNVLTQIFDFVGTKNYSYNRQTGELWLYNTRWNVVGAKDEGSEKYIRGRTVGVAYGDELTLIPKSFFEMMLTRMSPEGARLYGTTNPGSPFHYLKVDYLDDVRKREAGILWSEHFVLEDNYSLSDAKREYYRTVFKGVFYQLYILGLWVLAEGVIYKDCINDENFYVDSDRPVGLLNEGGHIAKYITIDYGTNNPTVFLAIVDDGNTYWVDKEWYWDSNEDGKYQKTDSQHLADLKAFRAEFAPNAKCIIDPSAASFKAELTNAGLYHSDADNEVIDGIRNVAAMLGKKKLKINKSCAKLSQELGVYSWDKRAGEKGEDAPIKKNDHAPDALRYFVQTEIPKWRLTQ